MPILLFVFPFIILSIITRIGLVAYAGFEQQLSLSIGMVATIMALGALNDAVTLFYLSAPFALLALLIPARIKKQRFFYYFLTLVYFSWIFLLAFGSAGEYLFWEEFGSRYNFIAVDYLVYTREVTDNITESYPIAAIMIGLFILSAIIFTLLYPYLRKAWQQEADWRFNLARASGATSVMLLVFFFFNASATAIADNRYADQLSKNGVYTLFSAFRNNRLDYGHFYQTIPQEEAFRRLRAAIKGDNETYVSDDIYNLSRQVQPKGDLLRANIMLVSVESLSAEFLGQFGKDKTLTPVLNALGPEGLAFTRYYATGTRTVRGLEAMSLSVPPTPGNSIVRRPKNEGLFSIGSVFKAQGYDTKFIYGGYGYFDNMNYFFGNNDFAVIDRSDMHEVTFANAWGVADEDLFKQAIKEADRSYADKRPFFSFIMTTSNHRPYTYPEGKIDIPSGTGRKGAVKYTDYAIGQLLKQASTKPWFDNTIFVITADHCASSAGKTEIPVEKYHIPLIIYAPKLVKPGTIDRLASQMDLAPTILGLLNIPYISKFFGTDILTTPKERVLFGTYQKLGYMADGTLVVLDAGNKVESYRVKDNADLEPIAEPQGMVQDGISYYQAADYLFTQGLMKK